MELAATSTSVILDQHYSDSLLRLSRGSRTIPERLIETRRALPKKDLLVSLLLFGHAFVLKPIWYTEGYVPGIDRLIGEGLVSWIPNTATVGAVEKLCSFFNSIDRIQYLDYNVSVPYDSVIDGVTSEDYRLFEEECLEHEIELSDARFDGLQLTKELLYLEPVLRSHLRHLRLAEMLAPLCLSQGFPALPFVSGFFRTMPDVDDSCLSIEEARFRVERFLEFLSDLNNNPRVIPRGHLGFADYRFEKIDQDEHEAALSLVRTLSSVVLATLNCGIVEEFASSTGYAIKSTSRPLRKGVREIVSNEEYVLVQAQFESLGYPVVESIDDVLRLRENKKLNAYRSVIAEYSLRLRSDLEGGREKVLQEFERDLSLASMDLEGLTYWRRFENFLFYFSIPMAVLGAICGAPLTDLLLIPATATSKIVRHRRRRKLDWLLVGRPCN